MASNDRTNRVRSFIAIPLESEQKQRLAQLQRQLREEFPALKPAAPDNLHLTLQFLGERTQDELAEIGQIMLSVAKKKNYFNVKLEGLGAFPNPRRPRVLWIGLTPPNKLIELNTFLSDKLAQHGILPERQPFRPHLTLGRFKDHQAKAISLCPFLTQECGTMRIDSMVLYGSHLTAKGAIHTPLATVELATTES